MMDVSVKSLEVHPEDQDLISRLAALQDMHDQVRRILCAFALVEKRLLTEYETRSLTFGRSYHSAFGIPFWSRSKSPPDHGPVAPLQHFSNSWKRLQMMVAERWGHSKQHGIVLKCKNCGRRRERKGVHKELIPGK